MSCVEIPKVGSRKAKSPAKKTSYEDCVPFNQFIKHFEVKEKGLPYTHTSITPAKKYYVAEDDKPEMEKLYKEALERNEELGLLEKPTEITNVRCDIDIKTILPVNEKYTQEQVLQCVKIVRKAIFEIMVEDEKLNTICVVQEKPPRQENYYVKNGFHLNFPYVAVKTTTLRYIESQVEEPINKIFSNLDFYSKKDEKVFDKISSKCWLLYGSSKGAGLKPYVDAYTIDVDNKISTESLEEHFHISIRRDFETALSEEGERKMKAHLNSYAKRKINRKTDEEMEQWYSKNSKKLNLLLDNLKPERFEDYDTYFKLTCFFASYGVPEEMAVQVMSQSAKYDPKHFNKTWDNADPQKSIGFGSLVRWLQEDIGVVEATKLLSPVSGEWFKLETATERVSKTFEIIDKDGSIVRFAKLFHEIYGKDVKYVSAKVCYHYSEATNLWEKKTNFNVCAYITDTLIVCVKDVITWLNSLLFEVDKEDQKGIRRSLKDYWGCLSTLERGITTIKNIYEYLLGNYQDPQFRAKLDSTSYLLSVKNGVIDLKTGKLRPRRREDLLSFALETEYNPHCDTTECEKFVRGLMLNQEGKQDDELYTYIKKTLGYCITGEMNEEIIFIFCGEAGAGKGTLLTRMDNVFERYLGNHDIDVFMDKSKKNSTTSAIAQMKGQRMVLMSEANSDDMFNSALIKQISGRDKVQARLLYEDPFEYKPQCKMVIQTNELPKLYATQSIVRRFHIVPFLAQLRFKDDPHLPYIQENTSHFEADKHLKDTHDKQEGKEAWLKFIVKSAGEWYSNPNLKNNPPKLVVKDSKEYFQDNLPPVDSFFGERIVLGNPADLPKMKRGSVYAEFCSWVNEKKFSGLQMKGVNRNMFYKKMRSLVMEKRDMKLGWVYTNMKIDRDKPDLAI